MTDGELTKRAATVAGVLRAEGMRLCCAESCTGGWIAKVATDLAGSSDWFERGFVTYSNEAKQQMLDVSAQTLDSCGAVSAEVVTAMAQGALANSLADVSVAVSGVAGPAGGSVEKPVGTVWLAWAGSRGVVAERRQFDGDRESVRRQTVATALQGIVDYLE